VDIFKLTHIDNRLHSIVNQLPGQNLRYCYRNSTLLSLLFHVFIVLLAYGEYDPNSDSNNQS